MPTLDPRLILRVAFYCVAGLFIALGVRSLRPQVPAENAAYDALSKALAHRMVADSLALRASDSALTVARSHVEHHAASYTRARDTVLQHLTDTVQVKVFVARADSVVRACSELSESCGQFRVRAESSLATLRLDRDRWKLATESLRPGRFDRVKEWGIRALIGYGAFRAGQAVR